MPTGQTPEIFTHPSKLFHPRKGLRRPPSNNLVEVVGTAPTSEMFISSQSTFTNVIISKRLTICQLCAKLVYMPKNRIFKISDGTETKEVEALSFKKAVKSFQGSSKAKMITIEWITKAGELFVKNQKIPLGRKKKIGR